MLVIKVVCLDYENLSFVVSNPGLIAVIQIAEVFDAYAFLIFTSSFLDLCDKSRD